MRLLSNLLVLICFIACTFRPLKIDRFYSSSIYESKENGLFCFAYKDDSFNTNIFESGWIERKAKYNAGFVPDVQTQEGYGLHLKFNIQINYTDTLMLFDKTTNSYLSIYQTFVGQENYRIYFINKLKDSLNLIPIFNGDTLTEIKLRKASQ
jgi:hypothetical protein